MMFLVSATARRIFGDGYHWQWSISADNAKEAIDYLKVSGYFSGLAAIHFKFQVTEDLWPKKST
jgi:hypothetical protein